jgi:hypothetical protein
MTYLSSHPDMNRSNRRRFLGVALRGSLATFAAASGMSRAMLPGAQAAEAPPDADTDDASRGEILYNGIRLPTEWPPRNIPYRSDEPMPVPWLEPGGIPEVIPIDVGRQLFVDDFLVEQTDLERAFHQPVRHPDNPVLSPELDHEQPFVSLSAHPVWYDGGEKRFKMLYKAGSGAQRGAYLAVSDDGIHWERPRLREGTARNLLFTENDFGGLLTTLSLIPHPTQPERGYVGLYGRLRANEGFQDRCDNFVETPDLLDWTLLGVAPKSVRVPSAGRTIHPYDVSRVVWNPFRKVWVYDIKQHSGPRGRCRFYRESRSFDDLWKLSSENTVFWVGADRLDEGYPGFEERFGIRQRQLYDHDAVAYESLMLGTFAIWAGPDNDVCERMKIPKVTQLTLGYSRDGFHWHRPEREPFLGVQRDQGQGQLDFGYIRPAGRVCLVVGDALHFYYSSASGVGPDGSRGIYHGRTVSLATLRRDGFASMDADQAGGTLTTRPVSFTGSHLFVNLDAPDGELRVAVLDEEGSEIAPFTLQNCRPLTVDNTLQSVTWDGSDDLSKLNDRPVRFRFELKNGSLYSFWVSQDASGRSDGYMAAGGPGYPGTVDTVGRAALGPQALPSSDE